MNAISQGTHSATYGYEPNSSLVKTINHAQNSVNRLTETRVYDNLNRLRSITNLSSAASDAVVKSFTYSYNSANQRTAVDREDNTRWEYGYDALGHVTSAVKKLADNASLAGHQFGYSYDTLGNRISATFGGDSAGTGGFQTLSYTPNPGGDRNQYSAITHPGVVLATGKANAAATVTVNQEAAQDRQGAYYSHQLAVPNELGPQSVELTTAADDGTDVDTVTRNELVPTRNATQTFDADGNLTFDGYRDWVWDAENRLISVETREALVPTGLNPEKVEYSYDYLSRRIQRRASQKFGNRWEIVKETRYLYDGWNVIAELDGNPSTPTLIQSYLWGIDLSGTAQGAGGVGGLLAVQRHVGAKAGVHFVAYDGNGNVVALADGSDGKLSASYEYDAFGNLLEKSGVFAEANPYRFSTKPQDEVTGLYYYGYRYYDPGNGRWLNRDPMGETGGFNVYGFVGNNAIGAWDYLGYWKGGSPISGKRGSYSGSFCKSSREDTLDGLAKLLPGSANAKSKLVIKGRYVDARDYLVVLENELREEIVRSAAQFKARKINFGPATMPPPSYNESSLNNFFNPAVDPDNLATCDCFQGLHLIMARAVQQSMLPNGQFTMAGMETAHFYRGQKYMQWQSGVNTGGANVLKGDWGYARGYEKFERSRNFPNGKWASAPGHEMYPGENVLSVGGGQYYGFVSGGGLYKTIPEWQAILKGPGHDAKVGEQTRFGALEPVAFPNVAKIVNDVFKRLNAK
ncbi:MAG: hypothetical protein P1U89_06205 [Verrucomicrobiales bacterium]|nr:hypothetical protein [Verrucomicrobiales bacterium]